jgi:hypothetical protein
MAIDSMQAYAEVGVDRLLVNRKPAARKSGQTPGQDREIGEAGRLGARQLTELLKLLSTLPS